MMTSLRYKPPSRVRNSRLNEVHFKRLREGIAKANKLLRRGCSLPYMEAPCDKAALILDKLLEVKYIHSNIEINDGDNLSMPEFVVTKRIRSALAWAEFFLKNNIGKHPEYNEGLRTAQYIYRKAFTAVLEKYGSEKSEATSVGIARQPHSRKEEKP